MFALVSTFLLALAAAASAAPAAPAAPAKRDISHGATLGPLPLIINTWYDGHSAHYKTTNVSANANDVDSKGNAQLQAYPGGRNATAEPVVFQILGSDALGISPKVNWTSTSQANAFGVIQLASDRSKCIQAIGWGKYRGGYFAAAPCKYVDDHSALDQELFQVLFQPSGPSRAWGYWHLYFVGGRPYNSGINGYTPSFGDDNSRNIEWTGSDVDTNRNLFCFPFHQYIDPVPGA